MKDRLDNIFSDSECISEETMYAYIENKLTSQERRLVEVHLASCELCSDALEGLSLVRDKDKIRKIVADINEKITAKNLAIKPKSFWMNYRFSIAAALAFLIISVGAYIMITTNNNKDEKIFAEKFKPFPNEVTKEKDGGEAEAKPDIDKGPQALGGKDVSGGLVANQEQKEQHLSDLEESDKSTKNMATHKVPTVAQGASPAKKLDELEKDRWTLTTEKGDRYSQNDSTSIVAETTPKMILGDGDVSRNFTSTRVMTDSITTIVAGDQAKPAQDYAAQEKSVYKSADVVTSSGTTENDKQEKVKSKATPSKENAGLEQNQSFAYARSADKKSDANKTQTNNLPAPNMSMNGAVNNNDNNNINIRGARGDAGNYSIDNRTAAKMDTAMKKYEEKNYGGAINSFDGVLVSDANNYNALFYSGVSYLSLDKPDKAIIDFDKVLKIKDGKFYEAAQWYKALALIKLNDDKEAKKLLKEIISNGGTYKKQADETVNQLK